MKSNISKLFAYYVVDKKTGASYGPYRNRKEARLNRIQYAEKIVRLAVDKVVR